MEKSENRKPLSDIFMRSAIDWSRRSTCLRKKVGGILVRDNRIICTGYNGAPTKLPHCTEEGCHIQIKDGRECCIRTLHCEQAILSYCSRKGIPVEYSSLYITLFPCYDCAKVMINSGISAVFYLEDYTGEDGKDILKQSKIPYQQITLSHDK